MNQSSGYFMEPQNFSVNDGNGIRTMIFFAGCPLRCQWCSNPEGYTNENKVVYYEKTCIACGRCTQVCPSGVGMQLNNLYKKKQCKSCGICVKTCPSQSRKNLIFQYTSEELIKIIDRQKVFYRYSGGGVTFSGGEATLQKDILRDLVYKLYDSAVDLAIETSGYFDFDDVKDIFEKLNLIFVDIKHMDEDKHRYYTGVSNEKILENISKLNRFKIPTILRIPLIEGVNADIDNIRRTAKFAKENIDIPKIELLPYHNLGDSKYEVLGLQKPSGQFKAPTAEHLGILYRTIEGEGVQVISYK